jgi:ABC-type xylose transport system permease subunit
LENNLENPEFFRLGITIIYAIVIALSINASQTIFIPFYSIPANFLSAIILFYGYFFIITSWIEYHFLAQKFDKISRAILSGFILEIGILFLFYYIMIAGSENGMDYLIPDVYLFVTPLIFLLLTIKDAYRSNNHKNGNFIKYRNLSRNFLFISIIISLSYLAESYATGFQSFGDFAFYRDLIFAFFVLMLIVVYRVIRWREINSALAIS